MQQALPDITKTGSLISDYDVYLFRQGNHFRLYERLGSHPVVLEGTQGTFFAVWAPNAAEVSVIGDFNGWEAGKNPLAVRSEGSGIWEGFIPDVGHGALYKYHIRSRYNDYSVDKGDPFATTGRSRQRPRLSSGTSPTPGATGRGCGVARRTTRPTPRSPSTRCIRARGGRCRRRRTGR
ncbi:protein of unknown function [Methanoculleus bourgensis]|uniref:Glycoside hydrolase family 13 N-terminal domain-containing protein n=1 Tax=Methanoculleus bourgensis TaxID=83986 RepID=A0A0X3BRP4_9EURY|nr:protein of unknown function [Methanoculleus bourgensis]